MKKILFLIVLLRVSGTLPAQSFTLDEAIRRGLESRPEMRQQQLQIQLAERANSQISAQWMPQVNGTADLRWNTQLQTSVLPIGKFGIPGIGSDEVRTLQIGRPFNNELGIQVTQKIYDPNKNIDRRINDNQVAVQQNVLEESRVNIRYAITDAYYSALFGAERLQLARQTLERAQFNLKVIQNQLKDGVALKNDADRLALDERNAQWSLKKAEQDLALSMDNLRHQMGMPADASITLADPLMRILQLDTAMLAPRPEKRTEFQGEQLALELNALNEKKQLLRNQPTVSAYGNYALLQLNDRFNPFATGTWFPYNNLGIKASIPIYNGRQARLSADDYGLRQEINKTNLEKYKSDIDYEIRSQMKTLRQAQTDLIQSRQNIDLARQIFDTDRFRFEKGVLKQTDLKNSEYSLQTAENNYLEAVYNFLTAQLKFRKSAGLLRE